MYSSFMLVLNILICGHSLEHTLANLGVRHLALENVSAYLLRRNNHIDYFPLFSSVFFATFIYVYWDGTEAILRSLIGGTFFFKILIYVIF